MADLARRYSGRYNGRSGRPIKEPTTPKRCWRSWKATGPPAWASWRRWTGSSGRRRAGIEQYLTKLADVLDNWSGRARNPDNSGGLSAQVQALRDLTNPGLEPLTFNVPTAALLIQTLERLAEVERVFKQPDNAA